MELENLMDCRYGPYHGSFVVLHRTCILATSGQLKAPHEDRDLLVNKLRKALILYVIITLAMMWFMVSKPMIW